MAFSRTKYVNLLRSQVGYHEGRDPNGNWNNMQKFSPEVPGLEWSQGQPWCATFTAWGADELGARDRWPITASCATAVNYWKKRNRFTEYPVLGGPFYMGAYGGDHVGVVYSYDDEFIYTVEGNTNAGGSYQGDGVYLRKRPRRGAASPYGYGVPDFDEPIVSADPKLGGTKAATVPPDAPTLPVVSLAHVIAAAKRDPDLEQGGSTWKAEVLLVEKALAKLGFLASTWVDGSYGTKTLAGYSSLQRHLGYEGSVNDPESDASGIPGSASLTWLGHRSGLFRKVA